MAKSCAYHNNANWLYCVLIKFFRNFFSKLFLGLYQRTTAPEVDEIKSTPSKRWVKHRGRIEGVLGLIVRAVKDTKK